MLEVTERFQDVCHCLMALSVSFSSVRVAELLLFLRDVVPTAFLYLPVAYSAVDPGSGIILMIVSTVVLGLAGWLAGVTPISSVKMGKGDGGNPGNSIYAYSQVESSAGTQGSVIWSGP